MNEQTKNYRESELLSLSPLPIDYDATYTIQIKTTDGSGRSTKWINITGDELQNIEHILTGMVPKW